MHSAVYVPIKILSMARKYCVYSNQTYPKAWGKQTHWSMKILLAPPCKTKSLDPPTCDLELCRCWHRCKCFNLPFCSRLRNQGPPRQKNITGMLWPVLVQFEVNTSMLQGIHKIAHIDRVMICARIIMISKTQIYTTRYAWVLEMAYYRCLGNQFIRSFILEKISCYPAIFTSLQNHLLFLEGSAGPFNDCCITCLCMSMSHKVDLPINAPIVRWVHRKMAQWAAIFFSCFWAW